MTKDIRFNSNNRRKNKRQAGENPAKETLPATLRDVNSNLAGILENIQDEIQAIAQKQASQVSPEFNALMDGYVNKANESEILKVKHEHMQNQYEEMKLELKATKDLNRQLSSDLDAAREALRLSESDLHQYKRDHDQSRAQYEEKISALNEERDRLKIKVRDLLDLKEKSASDYNNLKAELLEYRHKSKQVEQEKSVEVESSRRTVREHEKIIEELKEQLDLRTREVEYKDALLNQLIRQASVDGKSQDDLGQGILQAPSASGYLPQAPATASQSGRNGGDIGTWQNPANQSKPSYQGSRWGAFRK
jgi:predicted  nucleic acid-binding Zn-ribbon protein